MSMESRCTAAGTSGEARSSAEASWASCGGVGNVKTSYFSSVPFADAGEGKQVLELAECSEGVYGALVSSTGVSSPIETADDRLSEKERRESCRLRCTNEGMVMRPRALLVGFEPGVL